ncbi:MAG: sulfatase-like hydrolase/transferase [Planctomycetota bacterium]|nr:sulfatase-like hydrolase/transferase [Planctomycetota bacterium]
MDARPQAQQTDEDRRTRGGLVLVVLALGLPLALYDFVLIERKFSLLTGGGFLQRHPLAPGEAMVFPLLFVAQALLLFLTVTAVLRWVLRKLTRRAGWTRAAAAVYALVYFLTITVQFEVYRRFRDGMDLALARELGGGDLGTVLAYVREELMGLFPLVVGAAAAVVAGVWVLKRYGTRLGTALGGKRWVRWCTSRRGLVTLNLLFVAMPLLILVLSQALDRALAHSVAHRAYRLPGVYATDFDRDGYGLLVRPVDQAPFDGARHPYALEVVGNDVDENGVGGDLPSVQLRPLVGAWDASKLLPRNVLVIVLESARHDLIDARVDGQPVMPTLARAGGARLNLIAHVGFTVPGICSILAGTLSPAEAGTPLFDRVRALGYETVVFSGQAENFGGVARRTGMDRVDIRWDADRFPPELRMYGGTSHAALMMPAHVVRKKFAAWLELRDPSRPFLAYVNIQEMHFPYHYSGMRAVLVDRAIPRAEIAEDQRAWLERTYRNAAHAADRAVKGIFELLTEKQLLDDTVILITGDHGEELYDNGFLGHGVDLSFEQNATLGLLLNSGWTPPDAPIGLSELGTVIHNALLREASDALPVGGEVLCFTGRGLKPRQIARVDAQGMTRYDFSKDAWTHQPRPGVPPAPTQPRPGVVHAWESYVLGRLSAKQ